MERLQKLISEEEIGHRVTELAKELETEYSGKDPVFIGVLTGSFVFMADLIRKLDIPLQIDFTRLSSYGTNKHSSGKIDVIQEFKLPLENRHVVIIEDIVDTGLTIQFLLNELQSHRPASIKTCTLLDKPSKRQVDVPIDFVGFTVPDVFVVGYGIDFDEKYRYLPDIYGIED